MPALEFEHKAAARLGACSAVLAIRDMIAAVAAPMLSVRISAGPESVAEGYGGS
jgi:hypothetical protein